MVTIIKSRLLIFNLFLKREWGDIFALYRHFGGDNSTIYTHIFFTYLSIHLYIYLSLWIYPSFANYLLKFLKSVRISMAKLKLSKLKKLNGLTNEQRVTMLLILKIILKSKHEALISFYKNY